MRYLADGSATVITSKKGTAAYDAEKSANNSFALACAAKTLQAKTAIPHISQIENPLVWGDLMGKCPTNDDVVIADAFERAGLSRSLTFGQVRGGAWGMSGKFELNKPSTIHDQGTGVGMFLDKVGNLHIVLNTFTPDYIEGYLRTILESTYGNYSEWRATAESGEHYAEGQIILLSNSGSETMPRVNMKGHFEKNWVRDANGLSSIDTNQTALAIMQQIEQSGRKLQYPILYTIETVNRGTVTWKSSVGTIIDIVSIAVNIIPGVGQAISLGLQAAKGTLVKLANGKPVSFDELTTAVEPFVPENVKPYLNKAQNAYQAYQNQDYATIAREIGLADESKAFEMLESIKKGEYSNVLNGVGNIDQVNAMISALEKNEILRTATSRVINGFFYEAMDKASAEEPEAVAEVAHIVTSSTNGLPAQATPAFEDIALRMLKTPKYKSNPGMFRAFFAGKLGIPAFQTGITDEYAIDALCQKAISGGKKDFFVLPADVPVDKRDCFMSEITARTGIKAVLTAKAAQSGSGNKAQNFQDNFQQSAPTECRSRFFALEFDSSYLAVESSCKVKASSEVVAAKIATVAKGQAKSNKVATD